jgi:protein SCO1/2
MRQQYQPDLDLAPLLALRSASRLAIATSARGRTYGAKQQNDDARRNIFFFESGKEGAMSLYQRTILIVFCSLALLATGCNRTRTYSLEGRVVSKNSSTSEIIVAHGDIPGFMPAMTMPYRVKQTLEFETIQPGDKITAHIVFNENGSEYWLENVRITNQSGRKTSSASHESHQLTTGEHPPDIALVNQDGRTIHLSDYLGKALLITFIYTRCPMPEFCPRLSSQFARIQDELKKNPQEYEKTHLLTISFDPAYDTPAVLRRYGLAYLDGDARGFSHWDFASTTREDLQRVSRSLGLQYEGQENQFVHTMNIVLIAPDGSVAYFWNTNWTWQELINSLRRAATNGSNLRGQGLYGNLCARCHEVPNPDLRKQPPNLHGVFKTGTLPSGVAISDEKVLRTIMHGLGTMPPFEQTLSEKDARDIVAYLHTLN